MADKVTIRQSEPESSAFWPRASVTILLPLHRTGAAPLCVGLSDSDGRRIGYLSGSITNPRGDKVKLSFALDPAYFEVPEGEGPLGDGPSFAHDVKPLEEELALAKAHPEYGIDVEAVEAALREAKADAAGRE